MKKTILSLAIIAMMASCQSGPEGETAKTAEKQEASTSDGAVYTVDKATSNVMFVGSKPVGTHNGVFSIADGSVTIVAEDLDFSNGC